MNRCGMLYVKLNSLGITCATPPNPQHCSSWSQVAGSSRQKSDVSSFVHALSLSSLLDVPGLLWSNLHFLYFYPVFLFSSHPHWALYYVNCRLSSVPFWFYATANLHTRCHTQGSWGQQRSSASYNFLCGRSRRIYTLWKPQYHYILQDLGFGNGHRCLIQCSRSDCSQAGHTCPWTQGDDIN